MYDELIKTIRHCVATMNCATCPVDSIDEKAKAQQRCVTLMLAKAADAIEELSNPRWISVEERLPEEFQSVWAACKSEGRENWTIETVYDPYLKCPWGYIPMLESGKAVVYAWMDRSAPDPPKEET